MKKISNRLLLKLYIAVSWDRAGKYFEEKRKGEDIAETVLMINTIKIPFEGPAQGYVFLLALSWLTSMQPKVFSTSWGPSRSHLLPGHKINKAIDSPLETSVCLQFDKVYLHLLNLVIKK